MLPFPYWVTVFLTTIAVVSCVTVHYEGLRFLSDKLPMPKTHHRRRIIILIFSLLLIHMAEIWLFGVGYYIVQVVDGFDAFADGAKLGVLDCVYFSATVFTTLGIGDIVPIGPIRFMTGVEAVAGLTLITWSASYTLMEMLKTWDDGRK